MNALIAGKEHYLAAYRDVAAQLPGSGSARIQELRRRALARFEETGFPTTRQEDWKYTRLTSFENRRYSPHRPAAESVTPARIDALLPLAGARLVFIDGHFQARLSDTELVAEGITFTPLAQALEHEDTALLERWEALLAGEPDAFTALNLAYAADGACLHVAKDCQATTPIHLIFIDSGAEDSAAHCFNLLVVEEGGGLDLSESHFGLGDNHYFSNSHSEIRLGCNARLDHYRLQQEGPGADHVARLMVEQLADSRLGCHLYAAGARLAREDIHNRFEAAGGESLIHGLFLARGHQHLDFHTRTDHARPRCISRQYFRGILDEHARGVFNGRVLVHPQAQKTDARMASNNLLLSPQAEMDTKPQLEIYADDVKCTHGATVGQLDEDAMFYLRSRGLDSAVARGLVTYAFANEILGRMPSAELRSHLSDLLIAHMPGAGPIREIL